VRPTKSIQWPGRKEIQNTGFVIFILFSGALRSFAGKKFPTHKKLRKILKIYWPISRTKREGHPYLGRRLREKPEPPGSSFLGICCVKYATIKYKFCGNFTTVILALPAI
jgi:hypothetical protein